MYGAGQGNITIGGVVVGGTPGSVLFVGAAGALAQDNANFNFNDTTNTLTVAAATVSTGNLTVSTGAIFADGAVSESARGVDNVRLGVLSGNPRIIFENASATQWEIDVDAAASDFRWFNPGVLRMSLTTGGALRVLTSLSLGSASADNAILTSDAANIIAQRNGTNAQTARFYGTTTGSVFLALNHDGTNANISASAGVINLNTNTVITLDRGLRYTNQTNQAGAEVGTLTNSPVAGNPAVWVPIIVNGTNRSFPVW